MNININGVEYWECSDCGGWTRGMCKCREESKSKEIVKFLDNFRKKYNHLIMITPNSGRRMGMSDCSVGVSKFAEHAVSETEENNG